MSIAQDRQLWQPGQDFISASNMTRYMGWLAERGIIHVQNYDALYEWSISDPASFWSSVASYFDIAFQHPYENILRLPETGMLGTKWFEASTLSYAEHVFRNRVEDRPAIIFSSEGADSREISWSELEAKVAAMALWMRAQGIVPGDRVVSLLPNIPENVIAFLSANSLGAIWSSCSPDFGVEAIRDRVIQVAPKLLIVSDGYRYGGKAFDRSEEWSRLIDQLPSVRTIVNVDLIGSSFRLFDAVSWHDVMQYPAESLSFEHVFFDHPIWILFSSGTTGRPKAIAHPTGGILLEHLKALVFHQDVRPGERYFWYSTTGWMMWNYALSSLLAGATLVLYDGSAGYPGMDRLWHLAQVHQIQHVGGGAAFYIACMKAGISFDANAFPHLRTIGSTGSPLPPEAFEWIYEAVKRDVWLISLSGGTDVCSAFVGGCPLRPVVAGEIQCRMLGCDLESFDAAGRTIRGAAGEMVIRQPMPSMPVYFWDDQGNTRYRASYFSGFPDVWTHGDWVELTDRDTLKITGRSDATLNRDGVRIGTAELYRTLESMPEVSDSLVVCIDRPDGSQHMPLFVVLTQGVALDEDLKQRIRREIRTRCSPRHVPDEIISVPSIPYTLSGKKTEMPVKRILMGSVPDEVISRDTLRDPSALDAFIRMGGRAD
ncbi:MAG: acetoacetate--CoA ligase [Chitinophagaceae bacterium]|nr:acetoacetate--CoA ligase [Chitinophagaceae bacterium]